jgi:hypothetical protein
MGRNGAAEGNELFHEIAGPASAGVQAHLALSSGNVSSSQAPATHAYTTVHSAYDKTRSSNFRAEDSRLRLPRRLPSSPNRLLGFYALTRGSVLPGRDRLYVSRLANWIVSLFALRESAHRDTVFDGCLLNRSV